MNKIEEIGKKYPRLTLLDLRLIALLDAAPGLSIREAADMLHEGFRAVQERVAILSTGRKRRKGRSCYGMVTNEKSFSDRRERSLALTPIGNELNNQLKGTEQ
ncbi:MAG: hypothetical protein PHI85_09265 [Victivallaceae bacterium]|nr:hypothetical protein [Victivallaceae bacterium]